MHHLQPRSDATPQHAQACFIKLATFPSLNASSVPQAVLDYDALDLQPFYAGALVRYKGGFHRVADPLRHPADGVLSLLNPVGFAAT